MYRFDYCQQCQYLYQFKDVECPNCHINRFQEEKPQITAIDKKMKSFFLCANLKNIQQSFFGGTSKMFSLTLKIQAVLKVLKTQLEIIIKMTI
jgi:hypothetical protein